MNDLKMLFLLTLCLGLGACELGGGDSPWSPEGVNDGADPVSPVLAFPDVPVPNGFQLDAAVSFSKQKNAKRFGKLVYKGRMELNELEAFLIDQLEFQQWKLESKTLRGGTSALFFTKGTEELDLYITGSGWGTRLEIIVG